MIEKNDMYEAMGDGIISGFMSEMSLIGKVDSRFIDNKFLSTIAEKSCVVVSGLFEYVENITGAALIGISNNRISTKETNVGKAKQNPGRWHTRTWFKEREM